jgi:hypothetical protein
MKKFKDGLNTAVFTTKFVIQDKKEITYVYHYLEDGAWQFSSDDNFDNYEDIAMILSLDKIIQLDKSIVEIADLPLGFVATRKSKTDNWTITRNET